MQPQINISSLDFQDIRNSLINYLNSDQTVFKSYPFTGSALSTLIDVLAYNTLYYGFYSNMVANETFLDTAQLQSNITALLKPLGYIVNGMNSSRLTIQTSGTNLIAYQTSYSANSGVNSYRFYPIKNYTIPSGITQEIELFEAASVVTIDDINSTDLVANQSYFINDPDIDINTISITVDGTVWERYSPTTPFYSANNKIYFIDRTDEGFYILFSKYNVSDIPGLYGNQITANQTVKLQYLKPTGENANNAVYSGTGSTIGLRPSGGGGRPNLDLIKTFVPKLFASAERAITKDDYHALLFKKGVDSGLITQQDDLNVWGGDELQPPLYGRIFYSFNNSDYTPQTMKDITNYIKEKGMLTTLPEYVPAIPFNVSVTLRYTGSANSINLLNAINAYYSNIKFNGIFSVADLITELRKTFSSSALSSLTVNTAKITTTITSQDTIINLNTPIQSIISEGFTYPGSSSQVYLKSVGTNINLYEVGSNRLVKTNIGNINVNGIIDISKFDRGTSSINITVIPTYISDAIIAKNQHLLTVTTTISK